MPTMSAMMPRALHRLHLRLGLLVGALRRRQIARLQVGGQCGHARCHRARPCTAAGPLQGHDGAGRALQALLRLLQTAHGTLRSAQIAQLQRSAHSLEILPDLLEGVDERR